ncbi:MAG: O-antigen ligase family protein [Cyclobacteriaceae bacterium]|nr:O-antigen ligase family protein [Cyclobacteriaceae bacterium]
MELRLLTYKFILYIIVLILIVGMFFVLIDVKFGTVNLISTFALTIFVLLVFVSFLSKKYFFSILPIILLYFPSAVNNFFPSFLTLSGPDQFQEIAVFNHIDIFLILNLIRYKYNRVNINSIYFYIAISLLFISSLINLFYISEINELKQLMYGTKYIRFLLYFSFLPIEDININRSYILRSIVFGSFVLISEALIYSILNGYDRLTSGSLGVNTFANLLGSIVLFIFFYPMRLNIVLKAVVLMFLFSAIILSGTRSTIIVLVLSTLFLYLKQFKWYYVLYLTVFLVIIYFTVQYIGEVDSRYNVYSILNNINAGDGDVDINISESTSSIYTRYLLLNASVEMIRDNPLFGVGAGRWNDVKHLYGFDIEVLIDSHNSYLTILSQFGLCGGLYLLIIYFKPLKLFYNKSSSSPLLYFNLFIIYFCFAAFFNSEINKVQLISWFSFILSCNFQLKKI